MSTQFNRRTMIQNSAGLLASLFVIGDLKLTTFAPSETDTAAAATFEFLVQELVMPLLANGDFPEISDELRQESDALSKTLKPSNAPQIFQQAQLVAAEPNIELKISTDVSVKFSQRSTNILTQILTEQHGESATFEDVVEFLLGVKEHFSQPDSWLDN